MSQATRDRMMADVAEAKYQELLETLKEEREHHADVAGYVEGLASLVQDYAEAVAKVKDACRARRLGITLEVTSMVPESLSDYLERVLYDLDPADAMADAREALNDL